MQTEDKNSRIYTETSIGNWLLSLIALMIPILNIIMLFIWGFSRSANPTKSNWAKATLILLAIWIILGILFKEYFMQWFQHSYPVTY